MVIPPYIQLFLIIFIIFSIINHKYVNEMLHKSIGKPDVKGEEIVVEVSLTLSLRTNAIYTPNLIIL